MNGDPLAQRAQTTPDRVATIEADSGRRRTFAGLDEIVGASAARLADSGVRAGDRLGLLADTAIEPIVAIHAAFRIGATLVPVDGRLRASELADRLDRATVDVLLAGSRLAETARTAAEAPVLTLDETISLDSDGDAAAVDPEPWRFDDPQIVLFTSGTTGEPTAVPLTGGNLFASAVASAFRLGVLPNDRWLLCLPISHMGGLAPVFRTTLYGTTVVIHRGFDERSVAGAVRTLRATGLSLVPTMLRRLLDETALAESLRFVLLGGAPAPRDLLDRCERRGVPVYPSYGLTETASQVATATPQEAFDHPGTVGRPLLGTQVDIVDDAGEPVPPDTVGEIVVDGPTVSPAHRRQGNLAGLRTGDLGYRDAAGRLWVTGRVDDRILTGGETVHPTEVVDVLESHPGVAAAAVVGVDDPEWGERVSALVVAEDPATAPEARELQAFCRDRLAGYKVPKRIDFAPELPRTASGTVDRGAVRSALR